MTAEQWDANKNAVSLIKTADAQKKSRYEGFI